MIRDILAKNLRRYREAAGLTCSEVAEKVGKSSKTISAWELGRGQPDADMLMALCNLYKIKSIADLYSDDAGDGVSKEEALSETEMSLISNYRKCTVDDQLALVRFAAYGARAASEERDLTEDDLDDAILQSLEEQSRSQSGILEATR